MNFYLFSYLTIVCITGIFLLALRADKVNWLKFIVLACILTGIYSLYIFKISCRFDSFSVDSIIPLFRPIVYFGTTFILVVTSYNRNHKKLSSHRECFFVATIVFLVREFSHNFNFILEKYTTPEENRGITGQVKLQNILVYIFIIIFSVALFKTNKDINSTITVSKKLAKRIIYWLVSVLILNTAYFFSRYWLPDYDDFIFIFLTMSELAAFIGMFSKLSAEREAMLALDLATDKKLRKLQEQQYQMSLQNQAVLNQKSHDLKHYIAYLKNEASSESTQKIIDDLEKSVEMFDSTIKTGYSELDTILTDKHHKCSENQISLHCMVEGKLLEFMEPLDLFVLFGNIMDNAIEYLSSFPDKDQRIIYLNVSQKAGMVYIEQSNPLEKELAMQNGLPITSKSDPDYHGFGLKSILSICNKYNGRMTINTDNNIYKIKIIMGDV